MLQNRTFVTEPGKLVRVDRLGEPAVDPRFPTLGDIFIRDLSCVGPDLRQRTTSLSGATENLSRSFVARDPRHHQVHENDIKVFVVGQLYRHDTVRSDGDPVTQILQRPSGHQLVYFVVLYNQNIETAGHTVRFGRTGRGPLEVYRLRYL